MANKFTRNITLSNKDIRGKRADIMSDNAKAAQQDLINALEAGKRQLTTKLMDLEDLSPDSELSLRPTKSGFDAEKWVSSLQEVKIALIENEVRLNCALGTFKEYFADGTKA